MKKITGLLFFIFFISSNALAIDYPAASCPVTSVSADVAYGPNIDILAIWSQADKDFVIKQGADFKCPADRPHKVVSTNLYSRTGVSVNCLRTCTCPAGSHEIEVPQPEGTSTQFSVAPQHVCQPDEQSPTTCPSGQPKFNGSCQVCFDYNSDGSCHSPAQCDGNSINQGTVNGQAVCQPKCNDSNDSWGVINGVPGCYGTGTLPKCPNGGAYGSVNGVFGCYGGAASGSATSTGSNTSSGSGTSTGSNTSSGSGDSGGGNNSGGGSTGNNNSIGASYGDGESCPGGFSKENNFCVNSRGDCPETYHQVVVSKTPFYFMCVANNLPASSAASSSPSSSSHSSVSSSHSSVASSSGSTGSSGGGNSGGNGSGDGTGGSGGESGAGECDPTSQDYLTCLTGDPKSFPDHTQTDSGFKTVDEVNADFQRRVTESPVVRSFEKVKTIVSFSAPSCPPFSVMVFSREIGTTIHCTLWSAIAVVLSPIMIAIWSFIAFRIFASA